MSLTVAAGGVGKSSLAIVEALAMATCKPLLGVQPRDSLKVWYFNGEDPMDELKRRIQAACKHYDIRRGELEDRLWVDSGRKQELLIAQETPNGAEIIDPAVDALIKHINMNQIDVLIVDPFISTHEVFENDNSKINMIAKKWDWIASQCRCSIELIHHARKSNGTGFSIEDSRGAKSLIDKSRMSRTLGPMTDKEAEVFDIDDQRRYFKVDAGKVNLVLPSKSSRWFRLESIDLCNGDNAPDLQSDSVGVATKCKPDTPFDKISKSDTRAVQRAVYQGEFRDNDQAKNWVGYKIAEILNWDINDPKMMRKTKYAQAEWKKSGVLSVEKRKDGKGKEPDFSIVGKWLDE